MPTATGVARIELPELGQVVEVPVTVHYRTPEQMAADTAEWDAYVAERERRTLRARWARFRAWWSR